MSTPACKICASPTTLHCEGTIMHKHRISYYRCTACGFIQTEEPYWLPEAYVNPSIKDIGAVWRNLMLAKMIPGILSTFFDRSKSFVDYGGGDGLFVRLMRDLGYDFRWADKYGKNCYAYGIDAEPTGSHEVLTAFEVFEHLPNPLEAVEDMLQYSPNILFSTALLPEPAPKVGEWWYFSPGGGQHISLYTQRAIVEIGKRHGLNYYSNGRWLHLLTPHKLSQSLFNILGKQRVADVIHPLFRRKGLGAADYIKATGTSL